MPIWQRKGNNNDQSRDKQNREQKNNRIKEPKSWFFEKKNNIDKPLGRPTKKKMKKYKELKSEMKMGTSLPTLWK